MLSGSLDEGEGMTEERSLKATVYPDEIGAEPITVGPATMRPPISCPADATVLEAARVMADRKIGAVVLEGDSPAVLTERDVVFAAVEGGLEGPARLFASTAPVTIDAAATLDEAARVMVTEGVRHLLVREDGQVVGMFSVRDLLANEVVAGDTPIA